MFSQRMYKLLFRKGLCLLLAALIISFCPLPQHPLSNLLAPETHFLAGKRSAGPIDFMLPYPTKTSLGGVIPDAEELKEALLETFLQEIESHDNSRLEQLIEQLKNVPLDPNKPNHQIYLQAGWKNIDWDQLRTDLTWGFYDLTDAIRDEVITIMVHENGSNLGFLSSKATHKKALPIYSFLSDETKIHITLGLLTSDDLLFKLQVLFNTLVKELVYSSLEKNNGVNATRLAHPITTALEPLLEPSEEESTLNSTTQKVSLLYAVEHDLTDYLKSIEPDHPLDFENDFYEKSQSLIVFLEEIKSISTLSETTLELKLNQVLAELNDVEKYELIFSLLKNKPLPFKGGTRLIQIFLENKRFFNKKLIRAVSPHFHNALLSALEKILSADIIESNNLRLIEKTDYSTCYTHKGKRLLKIANHFDAIKFFIYERNILTFINQQSDTPPYFPYFLDGLKIVRIDNQYELALEMEYIPDSYNLSQQIEKGMPLTTKTSVQLMWQFLEALAFLQKHDIVVRDIKPANFLIQYINRSGLKYRPYLIDFGMSHFQADSPFSNEAMIGTPHFNSYEEILAGPYTQKQDLYKTGLLFYYLFSRGYLPMWQHPIYGPGETAVIGEPAPSKKIPMDIFREINETETFISLKTHVSGISMQPITSIIDGMVQKKLEERPPYSSALDVMRALAPIIEQLFTPEEWKQFVAPKYANLFYNTPLSKELENKSETKFAVAI